MKSASFLVGRCKVQQLVTSHRRNAPHPLHCYTPKTFTDGGDSYILLEFISHSVAHMHLSRTLGKLAIYFSTGQINLMLSVEAT